jgi:hypothetical protein
MSTQATLTVPRTISFVSILSSVPGQQAGGFALDELLEGVDQVPARGRAATRAASTRGRANEER